MASAAKNRIIVILLTDRGCEHLKEKISNNQNNQNTPNLVNPEGENQTYDVFDEIEHCAFSLMLAPIEQITRGVRTKRKKKITTDTYI